MSKIPLPKYLKMLTENGVPVKKAMELAGKLYVLMQVPSQKSEVRLADTRHAIHLSS